MFLFYNLPIELSFEIDKWIIERLKFEKCRISLIEENLKYKLECNFLLKQLEQGIIKEIIIACVPGNGNECNFFDENDKQIKNPIHLMKSKEITFVNSTTSPSYYTVIYYFTRLKLRGIPSKFAEIKLICNCNTEYIFKDEFSLNWDNWNKWGNIFSRYHKELIIN